MKKITLLATLFMGVMSYGQTQTTTPSNGDFTTGTAVVDYQPASNPGNSGTIDGWLFKTVSTGVATTAEVVVEDGDNAFHVLVGTGSSKPNIRLEMQPASPTISPVPTTVVASGSFVYSIVFKIKFSAAITNKFEVASKFRQADNTVVNHSGWDSAIGGITDSGVNTTGKASIDATNLAVDTWYTVQVNYTFADVTLIKERNTLWFNMGNIPAGTHFYIDDVTEWISDDGVVLAGSEISTTGTTTQWNSTATWSGTVLPGATDNITINHSVTVNGDYTVNDLTVGTGGTLTFNKGTSLTVSGDFTNNATEDKVTIKSDSDQFSSLIVEGTATGDVRYKRYVNANTANDLISPPVTITSFADFYADNSSNFIEDPGSDAVLFGPYDNSVPGYVDYLKTATTTLSAGTGYRMGTTGLALTGGLNFHGTIVTGDVNVSITAPGVGSPWNLIGNPYASYIDFETFYTANTSQFADDPFNAIYGYDGDASDGWTILNNLSTGLITPGQGFFVKSKTGGGTVAFTPAMRTIGSTDDFILGKVKSQNIALAKLNLSNATDTYTTDIYFVENQTKGLDTGYDAGAYGGSAKGIFTHLVEDNTGVELAIQALAYTDFNNVVVPLGIKSNAGVQISIGLDGIKTSIPSNIKVYLQDNVTNIWTLLNNSDYTFTPSVALNDTGRFFAHFSSSTLSTEESKLNGLQIYATSSTKELFIKGQLAGSTTVNIYDIQGRLVLNKILVQNSNSNAIDISIIRAGVYIVKVNNGIQTKTQKIIIKS